MRFDFFRLRFHFRAAAPFTFPAGAPANLLRGSFGAALHRLDPQTYARIFEPHAAAGPSGLRNPPRPFVFRARHLDAAQFHPGDTFHFDLHLFDLHNPPVVPIQQAVAASLHAATLDHAEPPEQLGIDLAPAPNAPTEIRVHFLTPTELKSDETLAAEPHFPILFARIRDRIATLSAAYGYGPLDIDFREMADRAGAVAMTASDLHHVAAERHSRRTGQTHPLGGFLGSADYAGDLAPFLPYLLAAQFTGVGRQTVWGKGEIQVQEKCGA